MKPLAAALALCATLGAQPADELDRLSRAHQWFELRSAVTDRSSSLMRAAVATAFNDPETAERLLRDVIGSAAASNAADDAYGMLIRRCLYLFAGAVSFSAASAIYRRPGPARDGCGAR